MDINTLYSISGTSQNTARTSNNELDKSAFLKILVAQLSNQDPLNSQDNSQYISQLAQFSALEQSQNMNTLMEKMLISQKITEGSMMIGKNVTFNLDGDNYIQELVRGVITDNGNVYLKTNNGVFDIDSVIGIGDLENDEQGGTILKD